MLHENLDLFTGPHLSSKCNSNWSNEQLIIPNVTPSILNCGILKVVYFVKVNLNYLEMNSLFINSMIMRLSGLITCVKVQFTFTLYLSASQN